MRGRLLTAWKAAIPASGRVCCYAERPQAMGRSLHSTTGVRDSRPQASSLDQFSTYGHRPARYIRPQACSTHGHKQGVSVATRQLLGGAATGHLWSQPEAVISGGAPSCRKGLRLRGAATGQGSEAIS